MEWDVFISHASEDKEKFVIPLATSLKKLGLSVWFDMFSLRVGDSLSKAIDTGLLKSEFGIIVLSKYFISKGWTDYELRSLLAREIGNKKVILPIWYDITSEEIMKFSPYLADKFALNASFDTIEQISMKLLEVIKPEEYNKYDLNYISNNYKDRNLSNSLEEKVHKKIDCDFEIYKRKFYEEKKSPEEILEINKIINKEYMPFKVFHDVLDLRIDYNLMPLIEARIDLEKEMHIKYQVLLKKDRIDSLKNEIYELVKYNWGWLVESSCGYAKEHVSICLNYLPEYKKNELEKVEQETLHKEPTGLYIIINQLINKIVADIELELQI